MTRLAYNLRMTTPPFVLGVDGGQTSTKCALVSLNGRVIGHGTGMGIVHFSAEGALDLFERSLRKCVASAFDAAGMAPQPLAAITLGLTGVERGTPEAHLAEQLARDVMHAQHIEVCSDADAALFGAHAGRPGIIVISGTGSHVRGMNASGEVASAGGWGWLLGDEGSAMWIGREGLMAALRDNDGSGDHTALTQAMRDHLGLNKLRDDAKRIVYQNDFGAKGFASLAQVVSQAANAGDALAIEIIERGAALLTSQTRAVQARLNLPDDAPIAPTGGAFEHVHGLREAFVVAVSPAPVVQPKHSTAVGAALMARKNA